MNIIDFRVRPPYKSFDNDWYFGDAVLAHYEHQGGRKVAESARRRSMDLYLKEQQEAGIVHAVVTGRSGFGSGYEEVTEVSNDDIETLITNHLNHSNPSRKFSGVIGVDSTDTERAIDQIDRYITHGHCVGITMECGFTSKPVRYDDRSLYPIYEKCVEAGAFVIFTAGNVYDRLSHASAEAFDQIAVDFPHLRLVLSHAGWPQLMPTIWVALRHDNVWLLPDFYMFDAPGKDDFVYAINTMLRDRVMFGSCYPLISFADAIDSALHSGIHEDVLEDYLYGNAAQFLHLTEPI